MSDFESTKGSGNPVFNPTKDAEGDPRTVATADDFIDGFYVDKKENVGKNNANVYTIETDEGEKRDIWGTKALNDLMDKRRFGDYIRIQWLGKVPTKAGALIPEKRRTSTDTFHQWDVLLSKSKSRGQGVASSSGSSVGVNNTAGRQSPPVDESDDLPF